MRQGTIDAAGRAAVDQGSQPEAPPLRVSRNALLPLMALLGAIYGWVLIVVAAVVALLFVLAR